MPGAIVHQLPASALRPLLSSQIIGDLVLMIPGEVAATGSRLRSCLAEWRCGGLADGRAEQWACQLDQRSPSVPADGALLVRMDPGSIPVPSSCLVPRGLTLVLPTGMAPRCLAGRDQARGRHHSSSQTSDPSCLWGEEEDGAESSCSSNLHPDLFKAGTKLLSAVRNTCSHGFLGASPSPKMIP